MSQLEETYSIAKVRKNSETTIEKTPAPVPRKHSQTSQRQDFSTESLVTQLAWELAGRVAARVRWTERSSILFQALGLACGVALIVVGSALDPLPTKVVTALGVCQVLLSGLQSLFDRIFSIKDTVQLAATGQKLETEQAVAQATEIPITSSGAYHATIHHLPSHHLKSPRKLLSLPSSRRLPGFVGFPANPTARERMLMDQLVRCGYDRSHFETHSPTTDADVGEEDQNRKRREDV